MDRESTIVPLDAAELLLSLFRVEPSNREYKRWRRDDGFRWVDLEGVLGESEFVLAVDWRESLQNAVGEVLGQLNAIAIPADAGFDDEGERGYIQIEDRRESIKYVPSDDDDFDNIIRTVNSLIQSKAWYRKFRSCEGSNTWLFGLLSNDDWTTLESGGSGIVDLLFLPK